MKQGCSGTKYATKHLEPGYQSPPTGTKNDCPAQAWITYCSLRLDQIETGVCGNEHDSLSLNVISKRLNLQIPMFMNKTKQKLKTGTVKVLFKPCTLDVFQ